MKPITAGMIGVNTASDDQTLLLVIDATKNIVMARPLTGGREHFFPAADFWPLITKLNGVK